MTSGFGNLSGSGPQQVWGNIYYISYTQASNVSTWYYEARYYGNGYGSWGAVASWSLSGFAVGGPNGFSIPQSAAYDDYQNLGSGYFNKGHDSAGYLAVSNLTFSISTNHSSIGSGSVGLWPGTAPRIPKLPSAPAKPVFNSADPDTINFTISAPSDNGGSTVTTYDIRVVSADGSTLIGSWQSPAAAQTTAGKVDLAPSTSYRILYAAKNGVGLGPYSAYETMTTEAGIYVSDGTKWVGAGPTVSDGTAWVKAAPQFSNGTAWAEPLDVLDAPEVDDVDADSPTQVRVSVHLPAVGLAPQIEIRRATNAAFTTGVANTVVNTPAQDAQHVVSGLTANTDYWWMVRWRNAGDTIPSMWSEALKARTPSV